MGLYPSRKKKWEKVSSLYLCKILDFYKDYAIIKKEYGKCEDAVLKEGVHFFNIKELH